MRRWASRRSRVNIRDNEIYDPALLDDFETFPYLWWVDSKATLSNPEIPAGSPMALPGQGAYEHILQADQRNGKGTYRSAAPSRSTRIGAMRMG